MSTTNHGAPAPTWEQTHHAAMAIGERWPLLDVSLSTSYPGGRPTPWTSGILVRDDARSEASGRQLAEAIAELAAPRSISMSVGGEMAFRYGMLAGAPAMVVTQTVLVEFDHEIYISVDGDLRAIDTRVEAAVALPAHAGDVPVVRILTVRDPDRRERIDDVRSHDSWTFGGVEAGLREAAVAAALAKAQEVARG